MRRKVTVLTGPGDGGAGALRHRAFLFRPNSEAVGPICSKRRLLWKSSGDPFVMWPPPPQAGRGAPVRRDKRRGIFLPGRSPYPALLHSPNSLPKVSFGEAKLRGFLSFYVSYHLFPGIYFMIKAYFRKRMGLYDENRNCYPLYFRGCRDRHPPLGPCCGHCRRAAVHPQTRPSMSSTSHGTFILRWLCCSVAKTGSRSR